MSIAYNFIKLFSDQKFSTVFYKYKTSKEKDEILEKIFSLYTKRIIFVSVFPNSWKLRIFPKNVIRISPFELDVSDLFSILFTFSCGSLVIIDSYPQFVNIYHKDKDKVVRLFLYILAKLKGQAYILVFTNLKNSSLQPIFSKIFLHIL